VSGESAFVNPETLMDWKSEELPKIIDGYQPKDMFNVDETGLFYNLQPSETLTYKGDSCHGGTKPKQQVSFLFEWKVDGSNKVPPLLTGRYRSLHCFENVRKLPTEYDANTDSWINIMIFEGYLT